MDVILVPQGAEYRAVCRGLQSRKRSHPDVVAIPIGSQPVRTFLQTWQPPAQVLVMGLCGSLQAAYRIGDAVLYQECVSATMPALKCDRSLHERLNLPLVQAFTSDRVIHLAHEKRAIAQTYAADVVDMEGYAILEALQRSGTTVSMLRVVSDDCHADLPDLSAAIAADGSLVPGRMAIAMLKQPIAATRLIRGSLRGLRTLQTLTEQVFRV